LNAVEIEQAISSLAEADFDAAEFPFAFLEAFGNKKATIDRLRKGSSNKSDIAGGLLQRSNIHMAVCTEGNAGTTLEALKQSKETSKAKAKFVLATDGIQLEAEDLRSGETVACNYPDFANHFGFFLPLAGISTVEQIRNNPIDIQATSRLNKLYVELLKENEEWASETRRHDMNHFMARLIFCFFAEDTDIFNGSDLFTATIEQMTDGRAKPGAPGSTEHVMGEIFRAMNVKVEHRATAKLPRWADAFPYVNGGLFGGDLDVPRFTRIASRYLVHAGKLDWTAINPDIFGSMIQAVADDEERGSLGMHYTSVPNILKVLNPLFLDDLREQLEAAGSNGRKLLNLRKRISKIRVFDPACGSGNFLVIAYKEMRAIEAEINGRRGEKNNLSQIPLTNFRGIEINDFPAEIARLALIIAEYQCDVLYRGQKEALAVFLPLSAENWITCGNALQLDWLSICPPTSKGVRLVSNDMLETPLEQAEIDFENEGGETYICGNPPYIGSKWQTRGQKTDLSRIFSATTGSWKSLDYVAGWFYKAALYGCSTKTASAFVSTNSICQGAQTAILWPLILDAKHEIKFAYQSFHWSNLASNNAGVTVVIVGIQKEIVGKRSLYSLDSSNEVSIKLVDNVNAYLLPSPNVFVHASKTALSNLSKIADGSGPLDGGHLLLTNNDKRSLLLHSPETSKFVKKFIGSQEIIKGDQRWCIWIDNQNLAEATSHPAITSKVESVYEFRKNAGTRAKTALDRPHRFAWINRPRNYQIAIPKVFSVRREFITADYVSSETVVSNRACIVLDPQLYELSVICSRMHWSWIATVCVRLRNDLSYSGTIGWNNFPVPTLTEKNKADLTRCAEDILLAREAHFPATIADLYDPEKMPDNLRRAHDRNDEVLERIYIGRRFKNDTERLEKLFELYTKMTTNSAAA
jgi:hypothetical protein